MPVLNSMLVLVVFCLFLVNVQGFLTLDLTGPAWTITQKTTGLNVSGSVPGSMFTALFDKHFIADPLYRDNDVKFAWPALTDWTYSRHFTVSAELIKGKQTWLICEGLDTIATVVVNGVTVGHSINMFVRSKFNVTGVLKSGDNFIAVNFKSAVKEALARVNNTAYVVPPECPPNVQNGQCHVNQIRKEQCSFSWDWGPSFPTQGIWKPIYIESYDNAAIREVSVNVNRVNKQWLVQTAVYFDVDDKSSVKGQLNVAIADLNVNLQQNVTLSSTNHNVTVVLPIPTTTDVPVWWPNGYGKQPLFVLNITFISGSDITHRAIKIGFRTVELVQDPVSTKTEDGLSFYVRVNSIPIFLKGSNWIPADSFQERITVGRLRYLLESAANVSINVLRVWGGGVYESHEFYQLCDELGILIWQDFMFSVALYPVYSEFLDSVRTEVRQQVRRLKHHPSILLWAGNNENEIGLEQGWFGTQKNYTLYYDDYVELYVDVIMTIVQEEDPYRSYLTSSPSDGKKTVEEGYVARDPGSELYGDIHYYDYFVDQWNASSFKIPRMASEFGVQAWCNNETLASVFEKSDYSENSSMVNHRQHHGAGNEEMAMEIEKHLNLPNSSDEKTKFIDFIYLTQINQAMSIRSQSEHYRRYQNRLLPDGRGLTMGALYWQLNDIWQAPTWASIDYSGAWKMLHYYAKSFFSKCLVSPYFKDANTLDVFLIFDGLPITESISADGRLSFQPIRLISDLVKVELLTRVQAEQLARDMIVLLTGTLTISIYNYNNLKALHSWTSDYNVKTLSESVFTKNVSELMTVSGCPSKQDCLLVFKATDSSGALLSTSWLSLAYPKDSKLLPANVKIGSIVKMDDNNFKITLTTDAIALFVWLATDIPGIFSDNGFVLVAPSIQIIFTSQNSVTLNELFSQLRVRSLADVKS